MDPKLQQVRDNVTKGIIDLLPSIPPDQIQERYKRPSFDIDQFHSDFAKLGVPELLEIFAVMDMNILEGVTVAFPGDKYQRLPAPREVTPLEGPLALTNEALSAYVARSNIGFKWDNFREPHWTSVLDQISMPERRYFYSDIGFVSTFFHECAHSTGHRKRLDRGLSDDFHGSLRETQLFRGFEEIVAEMASSMGMAYFGIRDVENYEAGYVKTWLTLLNNEVRCVYNAGVKASESLEYILKVVSA